MAQEVPKEEPKIARRVTGKQKESSAGPKAKEKFGKRGKAKAKAKEQLGKRGKAAPEAKAKAKAQEQPGKRGKTAPKLKAKSVKRKPAKQCNLEDLFGDMDDLYDCLSESSTECEGAEPGGGWDDEGLGVTSGEDDGGEETNDALYEVVSSMVKKLLIGGLLKLIRNWKLLAQKGSVDMGSGCTGSGLDAFAMKTICEVLAACLDARSLQRERRDVCFVVSFCLQMLLT